MNDSEKINTLRQRKDEDLTTYERLEIDLAIENICWGVKVDIHRLPKLPKCVLPNLKKSELEGQPMSIAEKEVLLWHYWDEYHQASIVEGIKRLRHGLNIDLKSVNVSQK